MSNRSQDQSMIVIIFNREKIVSFAVSVPTVNKLILALFDFDGLDITGFPGVLDPLIA